MAQAAPFAYVLNEKSGTISVIDVATDSVRAAIEFRADSKVYVNDLNADAPEGYGVVNLRTEYSFQAGPTRMFLFGRIDNVLDKQYAGSVIVNDQNGRFFEAAPGRRLFVGVRAVY